MDRQLQILAVDDDPVTLAIIEATLRVPGYEVATATNGDAAWESLLIKPAQLLITDWTMPGMDGPELIQRVRGGSLGAYVYIVLVTARSGSGDMLAALDAGADDYIAKPFAVRELQARVGIGERILRMEGELRSSRERLQQLAMREPVTGLLDQRALVEHAEAELARARDRREPVSIAVLRFQGLDTLAAADGDEAADDALREAANGLRERLRPYDWAGRIGGTEPLTGVRWGGHEFLVVMPGRALPEARAAASWLVAACGSTREGGSQVTVVSGVATAAPDELSLGNLRQRALADLAAASVEAGDARGTGG